jgi:magnesium chelatase family protein
MNPCPCGHLGDERIPCRCTEIQIKKYRQKLSGPLLDRLDMHVAVKAMTSRDLITTDNNQQEQSSEEIRKQIIACRQLQHNRQKVLNSELNHKDLEKICVLNESTKAFMQQAMDKLGFSARVFHRILKLARTAADLSNEKEVGVNHLSEAMAFRGLDRLRFEQR